MEFYEEQSDRIIRSKGFVLTEKGALQVQFCQAGLEVKDVPESIRRTELVLIVRAEDKDFIESKLRKVFNTAVG
jgi:G3E family GTPase